MNEQKTLPFRRIYFKFINYQKSFLSRVCYPSISLVWHVKLRLKLLNMFIVWYFILQTWPRTALSISVPPSWVTSSYVQASISHMINGNGHVTGKTTGNNSTPTATIPYTAAFSSSQPGQWCDQLRRLHFSLIIFDQANVECSKAYQLMYSRIDLPKKGASYICLAKFISNCIIIRLPAHCSAPCILISTLIKFEGFKESVGPLLLLEIQLGFHSPDLDLICLYQNLGVLQQYILQRFFWMCVSSPVPSPQLCHLPHH